MFLGMTLSSRSASLHPGGGGHLARGEHPIREGVEIFLVTSKRLGYRLCLYLYSSILVCIFCILLQHKDSSSDACGCIAELPLRAGLFKVGLR